MGKRPSHTRAALPKVDLDALTARQRGLVLRRQAITCGMDDEMIRRYVAEHRWQRVLPGLYSVFTGELTIEQKRLSAALYLRGRGQITGLAALAWHGFRNIPEHHEVHMLVDNAIRRSSRSFVRVHRAKQLDPNPKQAKGYVVCSVARSVADACRLLNEIRAVRAIVAEAVQRGMTTVAALHKELDRAGTSRTRLLRIALDEVSAGSRSPAEIDLQKIMAQVDGIRVQWNPRLSLEDGTQLPSPDGWLPDAGMALEVDSREYHLNPADWERTLHRHNVLSRHGVLVLHFTPSEVRKRPAYVRQLIVGAYHERTANGAGPLAGIVSHVDE